jgi:hypothetical protein
MLNTWFVDGGRAAEATNVCIAVAHDGLIGPAILDCGRKSLGLLARERPAQRRSAPGEEYRTFTCNLGP